MKKIIFLLFFFCLLETQAKEEVTGWGLSLGEGTSNITIGGRLQGFAVANTSSGGSDVFLRRARVHLLYQTINKHSIYVELRNDNSNQADSGERELKLGDAYYEVPIENSIFTDLTLFRSKVDVSYSLTSSSKNLIYPERAGVSRHASSFIVENRRANNIQLNGESHSFAFQLVASDGIQSEDVENVQGSSSVSEIEKQNLTFGGKIRFFLWGDRQEIQETFYRKTRTLSFGVGAFYNPNIHYRLSSGSKRSNSRGLYNLELSFAFDRFRLVGELFRFHGDTINLDSSNFGVSQGGYARSELILRKIAPYIGYNYFQRDRDQSRLFEKNWLFGVNYYEDTSKRRYGLSYLTAKNGPHRQVREDQQISTYILLNY